MRRTYGGGSQAPAAARLLDLGVYTHNRRVKKDVRMWYDDVVAATSYIGPQIPGS